MCYNCNGENMIKRVNHELKPIYNEQSEVLILGSIPSIKSREHGFYYGHPQNRFWQVLSNVYSMDIGNTNEEKEKFLIDNRIALWDVIKSCDIDGSSDASIKNIEVNNIKDLLRQTNIKRVFTTGKKAYQLYNKYCLKDTKIEAVYLPSTSPANIGNYNLEQLISEYKKLL